MHLNARNIPLGMKDAADLATRNAPSLSGAGVGSRRGGGGRGVGALAAVVVGWEDKQASEWRSGGCRPAPQRWGGGHERASIAKVRDCVGSVRQAARESLYQSAEIKPLFFFFLYLQTHTQSS